MNRIQNIIYEMLYGESDEMVFDITGLKDYIGDYPDLTNSIIRKVNRGDVYILEDKFIISDNNGSDNVQWKVKVKRK